MQGNFKMESVHTQYLNTVAKPEVFIKKYTLLYYYILDLDSNLFEFFFSFDACCSSLQIYKLYKGAENTCFTFINIRILFYFMLRIRCSLLEIFFFPFFERCLPAWRC